MRPCCGGYPRSHDCPRLGVFLCQHEWHHVDFAQCATGDNGIIREALVFLVIGAVHHIGCQSGVFILIEQGNAPKMLDRSTNSSLLKTLNIRGSNDSGQVRVLREGLKALGDVSLGRSNNKGATALYHRGGSEEKTVRNAVSAGYQWLTYTLNVAGWSQGQGSGSQLGLWREQFQSNDAEELRIEGGSHSCRRLSRCQFGV